MQQAVSPLPRKGTGMLRRKTVQEQGTVCSQCQLVGPEFVVGASPQVTLQSSQICYFHFCFICKCNWEGCGAFAIASFVSVQSCC